MVSNQKVFAQVDSNLIYPVYHQLDTIKKYGWDNHSIVADPLFDKKHEQWDITYLDYKLKPESPVDQIGFSTIKYDSIGLLPDFPFEKKLIKSAGTLIQAEDYNRMKDLRCIGSTGIYNMRTGAWVKYENIDFGDNSFSRFVCMLKASESNPTGEVLFEIRLDSPEGEIIGSIRCGETEARVKSVTGVHTLFLIFRRNIMLDNFRFLN